MAKYRIVEAKIPRLFDEEVTISYLYRYDVERLDVSFFGLIKQWQKCGSHYKLEHAKAKIEFLNTKETWTVIDVD
jgi:hypothetical protein